MTGAVARAAALSALLLAAALLAGCATRPGAGTGAAPDGATPAAVRAWQIEIDAPAPLAAVLAQHLDIARFQDAPETDRITPAELDRLAAAAPVQARALLDTEGHFGAVVAVERSVSADGKPLLIVHVQPGPRTLVAAVALDADGEAAADRALLESLRRSWLLKPGEPFRQAAWDEAKNQTMAALRAQGYPAAAWKDSEARVDASTHEARLRLLAASGPLFRLGALRIEGLARHDPEVVERLAIFTPGEPANERTLLDFQERLQKLGLFEAASVDLDTDPAAAAAAVVNVRVREQPLQQATAGVGVSANTGPRITLEHVHRKPFGAPWVAKNAFEFGSDRRAWSADLVSHPVPGLYRNLLAGGIEWLRSGEELRRSGHARIGRTQDTPAIERLYFAEYTHERLTNPASSAVSDALSLHYEWVLRRVDNVLLPTDGYALSAQTAAGYARSDVLADGPFAKLRARLSLWRPLGLSWYASARVEAGQVIASLATGVPDSLLYRAGGDESVRGYAYRSLGPTRNGALASGRALLTASAELARPISLRQPSLWGAAFVDAGNAADSFGALRPVSGYGVGLRWRSPVGPLSVDLAYGHAVRRLRLHLSVGIGF